MEWSFKEFLKSLLKQFKGIFLILVLACLIVLILIHVENLAPRYSEDNCYLPEIRTQNDKNCCKKCHQLGMRYLNSDSAWFSINSCFCLKGNKSIKIW